jgi:hypothetical protein
MSDTLNTDTRDFSAEGRDPETGAVLPDPEGTTDPAPEAPAETPAAPVETPAEAPEPAPVEEPAPEPAPAPEVESTPEDAGSILGKVSELLTKLKELL